MGTVLVDIQVREKACIVEGLSHDYVAEVDVEAACESAEREVIEDDEVLEVFDELILEGCLRDKQFAERKPQKDVGPFVVKTVGTRTFTVDTESLL